MNILMVGVSKETQGGMYTVVSNYLDNKTLKQKASIQYVPTSTVGSIPKRLYFSFQGIIKILKILMKNNIDIIHIHMSERGSVYRKGIVLRIAKFFKVNTITHMHGADFEDWYLSLSKSKRNRVKKIINMSDEIIILGENWRDIFSTVMIDESKINVIYNAVPTLQNNLYNENANSLLFLGALIERKGIYDILQVAVKLNKRLPEHITFDFYGPDPNGDFSKKIIELGLEKRVLYHGWLKNEDKNEVFSKALLNLLPSYNEGLPMTILETMAYGIPNISTNVAAIPEAIKNNINGRLIEPGDIMSLEKAILDIVQDKNCRKMYSQNAFQSIKNTFSIDHHIEELLRIYYKVMN
ncbi:glycosyltransferase family 4 protein [Enterococcus saccharolyticus]|uniref:glycosyltransferase family 4 protein n=1 Tax=Enterococcus saccharolyticus TaxID=41997 RepID=UPI001E4157D7|nr:glycosyltransferase family 4 protein [Enterococcus saccharolyticus]MCD5001691.1 glycosyltransferase family 4 protein [Enterococcus saccharolyticus]